MISKLTSRWNQNIGKDQDCPICMENFCRIYVHAHKVFEVDIEFEKETCKRNVKSWCDMAGWRKRKSCTRPHIWRIANFINYTDSVEFRMRPTELRALSKHIKQWQKLRKQKQILQCFPTNLPTCIILDILRYRVVPKIWEMFKNRLCGYEF